LWWAVKKQLPEKKKQQQPWRIDQESKAEKNIKTGKHKPLS
jgi:hypothetical protein